MCSQASKSIIFRPIWHNAAPNRGGMLEVLGDAEGGTTRGVDVPGAGAAASGVGVSENLSAVRKTMEKL